MLRHSLAYIQEHLVSIPVGEVALEGNLAIPPECDGIILFAHGSGSSRHSPRNRYVASVFQQQGLATLLLDLLTAEEEDIDMRTRHLRFDIPLLASRLVGVTDWLYEDSPTRGLNLGYFGASTGSAAALIAATQRPTLVKAIVSRGGRPDLAGSAIAGVQAPTLLIVGGNDFPVIAINEDALTQLCQARHRQLEIVPRATHLFEESGTLEQVAMLASDWFKRYLVASEG
jgi:dienelactone hydrolase